MVKLGLSEPPQAEDARPLGPITRNILKGSALILFFVGGAAGFVAQSIRSDTTHDVKVQTLEQRVQEQSADLDQLQKSIRPAGELVTQDTFKEFEKRVDGNFQATNENINLLRQEIHDLRARGR